MKKPLVILSLLACLLCVLPAPHVSAQGPITGKVVETMDSAGYTYVCLEKNGKKTWLAVPQMKVVKGSTMSFQPGMEMPNFESKSLKRTFPMIIFSAGPADASAAGTGMKPAGSSGAAAPPAEPVSVKKATGKNAYTIAELYAKKNALASKPVTVRGKVVKVSEGIMQRNWLHLQDGTGSPKNGNHDIVVTTAGTAKKDDIVTISGTLMKDKDFGMGYFYALIIENGTISK